MKLVDILARELKVWPDFDSNAVGQTVFGTLNSEQPLSPDRPGTPEKYTLADDWISAIVTRAEWQAAVDAMQVAEGIADAEAGNLISLDDVKDKWHGKTERAVERDGVGLPPVGIECETNHKEIVRILTHIDQECGPTVAVGQIGERGRITLATACSGIFRPIRTQEQIAADEREKAIREMSDIGINAKGRWAEAIYDAGYRKQPK